MMGPLPSESEGSQKEMKERRAIDGWLQLWKIRSSDGGIQFAKEPILNQKRMIVW